MAINFGKALGVHPEALKLRAERTEIIASNIANASTPGYQARDVDFATALQTASAAGDSLGAAFGDSARELLYRVPFNPSQDGNTVDLAVEQAAFSQNASDFHTSLTFVGMKIKGLAKAIEGR